MNAKTKGFIFLLGAMLIAAAISPFMAPQVYAQQEQPNTIVVQTAGSSFPWEALASAIIAFLVAIAAYLQNQRQKKGEEAIALAKDKEFQRQAVIDLAAYAMKAYQANADGKITQEEYNMLAEEGKTLAQKYAGMFKVQEEIDTILEQFTPKNPTVG